MKKHSSRRGSDLAESDRELCFASGTVVFTLSQCSPADPSLRKNSPRTGRDDPLKLAGHSGTAPVSANRKQPGWSKAELQRSIVREIPPELTLDESEVLCYTENEQNEMEKELTDEISRAWSGMSATQDENRKGLKKRNRRDNTTTPELVTKPHHGNLQTKAPESFPDNAEAAGDARKAIEAQTSVPVIPFKMPPGAIRS